MSITAKDKHRRKMIFFDNCFLFEGQLSHYQSKNFHIVYSTTDGLITLKLPSNCAAAISYFDNIYGNVIDGDGLQQ
jgi:hypothetical protein